MRPPTQDEQTTIAAAMDAWGDGLASRLTPDGATLLVRDRDKGLSLHLLSDHAAHDVATLPWPPRHAGLPLGRLVDDAWRPSLQATQRIPRKATYRYALLDEGSVGRFLYGRGVAADGVRRFARDATEGRVVFVYGPNDDALGLGRVVPDKNAKRRLDPIIDLGWYLREGG